MSNAYGPGKRQRENNQARKQQAKAEQRRERRNRSPRELPVVEASDLVGSLPSIEEAMHALENPGSVERLSPGIQVRLFVGGLSESTTEADLRAAFAAHGPVVDAVVMTHRATGAPRGFGFVTMANRKDAPKAIAALHGSDLGGQAIVVNVATERGR